MAKAFIVLATQRNRNSRVKVKVTDLPQHVLIAKFSLRTKSSLDYGLKMNLWFCCSEGVVDTFTRNSEFFCDLAFTVAFLTQSTNSASLFKCASKLLDGSIPFHLHTPAKCGGPYSFFPHPLLCTIYMHRHAKLNAQIALAQDGSSRLATCRSDQLNDSIIPQLNVCGIALETKSDDEDFQAFKKYRWRNENLARKKGGPLPISGYGTKAASNVKNAG
ncbi:hypothetical protein HW555_005578 [Spodoptera exigua]|uniref:Uncharacterized protein n=1 Tax=Spodoptera exigua TaxID=7107 RepID=A0A835LAZ2_SPOEX|nr:hypothetical protein HW555_005578 [Spodoptera exigua]